MTLSPALCALLLKPADGKKKKKAGWIRRFFIFFNRRYDRFEKKYNICLLYTSSGGVDSSVVAALLLKAIGNNLVCVHVNHGFRRKGESEAVIEGFKNLLNANLIYVDATDRFLSKLENVADPEQKRKIIGGEFIRVFEEEARKLNGCLLYTYRCV